MGAPFWGDIDNATGLSLWDVITIGGIKMGGLARVKAKKGPKTDVKNSPGTNGATFTHLGFEPMQISITIRMWEAEHWETWQKFVAAAQPKRIIQALTRQGNVPVAITDVAKGKPQPMDVDHPALASHGVRSLYIASIEPPSPSDQPQIFEATIIGQEWAPNSKEHNQTFTPDKSRTDITTQKTAYGATQHKPPPSKRSTGP